MKRPLVGITPPMITPLAAPDTLDVPGLERLVEHLVTGGSAGLFILGTTGEGPSLSYRLRRELIRRTCQLVRGRVPVLVGITDTSAVEALQLAHHAADSGAQAVVTAPPYYFPLSQPELIAYVEHIASRSPLPLMLYNMPAMTNIRFELPTVRRLLHHDQIIGAKDSSGDLDYFHQLLAVARERPDWSVLIGPELLMSQVVQWGAHGGVNGGANVFPSLFANLYDATTRNDTAAMARLQALALSLDRIYRISHGAAPVMQGIKCALALLGICDSHSTVPFARIEGDDRDRLGQILKEIHAAIADFRYCP